MDSVVSNIPRQGASPAEEDRLLDLFWNRAELKKGFADLRAERDNLRERVRDQEGQILRARQRVEELEGVLADPVQSANASIFFQLRTLWGYGRRRLMRLSRDLATHEQERSHQAGRQAFESSREEDLASLDRDLAAARSQVQEAQQLWISLARRRRSLWAWFGDRPSSDELSLARDSLCHARSERDRIDQLRTSRLHEAAPAGGDLTLASRRRINLAVIALAQELLLNFDQDNLAIQAREAVSRQMGDMNFGSPSVCRTMSRAIATRLQEFESGTDLAARIRSRTRYLASFARYRLDTDAVPVASCFTTMPRQLDDVGGVVGDQVVVVNVLSEEYWDLYAVLLN
ncbi:MAG: hypothetical protein ACR2QB_11815 [Gammaproteobacteria bacterium]